MIKVKRLSSNAKLPSRANSNDAGADIFSAIDVVIPAGQRRFIPTGIAIQAEQEVSGMASYFRIAPRSGLAFNNGIDVLAGVVDLGYTGEIKVGLLNTSNEDFTIKAGDKIAQLIREVCIINNNFIEVDSLEETSRGEKGFGSTGTK